MKVSPPSRRQEFTKHIIAILNTMADMMPIPFESPNHYAGRLHRLAQGIPEWRYRKVINRLEKRGFLEKIHRDGKEFIQLTNKGHLELLCKKLTRRTKQRWDHKWRLAIFDIPEIAHHTRDAIRRFLKQIGFAKMQASVYITPYALPEEAVRYLATSGLKKYIRFLRVDECDNDTELRQHFQL